MTEPTAPYNGRVPESQPLSEYERAMLLLAKAQVELLMRVAYRTNVHTDGPLINEIAQKLDLVMAVECPAATKLLGRL